MSIEPQSPLDSIVRSPEEAISSGDPASGHVVPVLKGYRPVHALGSGGQGVVWLAIREVDGKKTAVKIMRAEHASSRKAQARFDQAIATLETIDHPRIVRHIEHGMLPSGEAWHATEYISGRTLLEYVNEIDAAYRRERGRDSRLPIEPIVQLFIKLCDAIEAAHRVGVIHRDLKPSNIIVDEAGEPHVLDFGHAHVPESLSPQAITMTGEFIGSPAYASPEQVQCRPGAIDTRSDIYAMGIMLYECLSGSFPYDVGGALARTFEQIQYKDPVPLRAHAPWIDRDLQSIVLKAIAKDPQRRYQSVAGLRMDLERFARGEAVHARGDGLGYRVLKLARRHRGVAVSAAVLVLVTIGYGASMTVLYRRKAAAEARAVESARDAREKFRLAHDAAAFLVSDIDKSLRNMPGAEKVRRSIMEKAQAQFAPLVAEQSDDPAIQADIARVYVTLGDLAYKVGDFDESLRHRKAALEIREGLAAAQPQDDQRQAELSTSLVLVGDIAKERADLQGAREYYDDALAIDGVLAAKNPGDFRFQDKLAWSLERSGYLARMMGQEAAGNALIERRHAICEELVAKDPGNLRLQFHLCVSCMLMSDVLRSMHDDKANEKRSDEFGAKGAEIAARLIEAEPDNAQYIQYYMLTRGQLAWASWYRRHDYETAQKYAQENMAQARRLYEAEPGNFMYGKFLSEAHGLLGDVALAKGDNEQALSHYHDRLAVFEQLHAKSAQNKEHLDRFAWLISNFDEMLARLPVEKRPAKSVELVSRCAALLPPQLADVRTKLKSVPGIP